MSVTISYGGVPVPKGWHLWTPESRPEPGRWFFEARYHHTGHFRLGLDFRPLDGAFPELWMPPLMWKYAAELEAVAKVIAQPAEKWVKPLLNVHPANANAFKLHMADYGEKWKKKKKLLFGTAEGAGKFDPEAQVDAELTLGEFEWSKEWTPQELMGAVVKGLVGHAAKSLSAKGGEYQPEQFGTDPATGQPTIILGASASHVPPTTKFEGKTIPYDQTLFDTNHHAWGADHRFVIELIGFQLVSLYPENVPAAKWKVWLELQRHQTHLGEIVMEVELPWKGYDHVPVFEVLEIKTLPTKMTNGKGTTYQLTCRADDKTWVWNFLSDKPVAGVNEAMGVGLYNPTK